MAGGSGIGLAELIAALSLGTDLGLGQPMEHVLRQSLIALRLGERLGLGEPERACLYYVSLLSWVGCHVDAYEQARWFRDDLALKADFRRVDGPGGAFVLGHLLGGRSWGERTRLGIAFLVEGRRDAESILENHWRAADALASRLGLGTEVRDGLAQIFERWDGRGTPGAVAGEDVAITARLVGLADVVEVYHRAGGADAAVAVARERRATQFDPALVDLFCVEAAALFDELETASSWDAVIAAAPGLGTILTDEETDRVLEAIAEFADLKSPFTLGHSPAVAELTAAAAEAWGLPADQVRLARRAALLHDLGRLGVSNAIWDKRGELTPAELERVRLHPYLTERMLVSSPGLAALGAIAVQHHERLDGSGYPRGLSGDAIGPAGRILAAADAYRAKLEPRPHRRARSPEQAAAHVRAEVRAGRLDGEAVECVLAAAGRRVRRRREWPDGLTAREVEVLGLVARGLSSREIAERLVISRKTARNHVEHIYAKIGVSNRARASLYAVQHGLVEP